ncbi:MAG TPA: tripartite tricarboxylate transporter substrate binding protein [Burkholderiales bacterium]|nr:tripartite tricarboxylate transporter substrate binding protein [Burkholderiales bacterium]
MNSVRSLVATCLALELLFAAGGTLAQAYPSRPVRIVVPTSPGGGNDFVARHVGQKLGERLGQQFIVDNRPGAGGAIGTAFVAKAPPDGYTLLLGFVGQLAMLPHVEKAGYDPLRDFVGVSLIASSYHFLAVHPSLPVRSVKQLVALAKKRPGELNYASGNIWTPTHLVPELFKQATGTDIVAIQYKGSGPAAIGVLSGEAQVIFAGTTAILSFVQSKRLIGLAVTSPKRTENAPEIPTLVELGVRGVEAPSWYSVAAPAATPREHVAKLHDEIVKLTATADYRTPLERNALEPTTTTPEQFAAFLQAEYDKWGKVVKSIKID